MTQSRGKAAAKSSSRSARQGNRLHPDPQRRRDDWLSLDGQWQFAIDARATAAANPDLVKWNKRITVPFSPETIASGLEISGFIPACWYRRTFKAPRLGRGQRLILRFGAVDYQATVWLNGRLVTMHQGGYTPFDCDITDAIDPKAAEQTVVVHAEDDPADLAKPRGKQDWQEQPHSIWYVRTTGIWQSVYLERVGSSWLQELNWTASVERFEIGLVAHIAEPADGLRLRVHLHVGPKTLSRDEYAVISGEVRRGIALSDPGIDDYRNELLWSPEHPVLITADLELCDSSGRVLDAVHSYTAMRSAGVLGDRFVLNGRPRYLRLVLDQGYWPESGLTPPDDEAARRDVELTKAMGFNGVRAHQRIADPRYLYFADLLGLLVWEEMPSVYRFSPQSVMRLAGEWSQAIARDRSHPSVIAWVPMNESWGVPDLPTNDSHRETVRAMYHLTRALDATRPVIGNDGWEMDETDIIAIHDYDRSAENLRQRYCDRYEPRRMLALERPGHRVLLLKDEAYRGQPIMLTEFGGIALSQEGTWGYSQEDSPEALANHYRQLLAAVHDLPVFSGFCYTQFADTYQEANGLLYADRRPKFPLEEIHAATVGER